MAEHHNEQEQEQAEQVHPDVCLVDVDQADAETGFGSVGAYDVEHALHILVRGPGNPAERILAYKKYVLRCIIELENDCALVTSTSSVIEDGRVIKRPQCMQFTRGQVLVRKLLPHELQVAPPRPPGRPRAGAPAPQFAEYANSRGGVWKAAVWWNSYTKCIFRQSMDFRKPFVYRDGLGRRCVNGAGLLPFQSLPESVRFADQPAAARAAVKVVLAHAYHDLCSQNDPQYDYFIQWWARVARGERNGTALYLSGAQGVGKTAINQFLARSLLPAELYKITSRTESIVGNFNLSLAGKVLVFFDDPKISNRRAFYEQIKENITGETLEVRRMRENEYEVEATANYIIASNQCLLETGNQIDRRFLELDVSPSNGSAAPDKARQRAIMCAMHAAFKVAGVEQAIYCWLREHCREDWKSSLDLPSETKTRREYQVTHITPFAAMIRRFGYEEVYPLTEEGKVTTRLERITLAEANKLLVTEWGNNKEAWSKAYPELSVGQPSSAFFRRRLKVELGLSSGGYAKAHIAQYRRRVDGGTSGVDVIDLPRPDVLRALLDKNYIASGTVSEAEVREAFERGAAAEKEKIDAAVEALAFDWKPAATARGLLGDEPEQVRFAAMQGQTLNEDEMRASIQSIFDLHLCNIQVDFIVRAVLDRGATERVVDLIRDATMSPEYAGLRAGAPPRPRDLAAALRRPMRLQPVAEISAKGRESPVASPADVYLEQIFSDDGSDGPEEDVCGAGQDQRSSVALEA